MRFVLAACRSKPALTSGDALLAEALRHLGATVLATPWDAIDPGREEGIVCLRSTWDYHLPWHEFRQWARSFGSCLRSSPAERAHWSFSPAATATPC